MVPDMQHFIIPLEEDLETKQHIIFSLNHLTRIKTNYVYPIKQIWKVYKTHFQNISSQAGAIRLGIQVHIYHCLQLTYFKIFNLLHLQQHNLYYGSIPWLLFSKRLLNIQVLTVTCFRKSAIDINMVNIQVKNYSYGNVCLNIFFYAKCCTGHKISCGTCFIQFLWGTD